MLMIRVNIQTEKEYRSIVYASKHSFFLDEIVHVNNMAM